MRRRWMSLGAAALLAGCATQSRPANGAARAVSGAGAAGAAEDAGSGREDQLAVLGSMIFFDESLSEPAGQSCASCHGPEVGFTGPTASVNMTTAVYAGAASTPEAPRFGNRKPSSAAYATQSPRLRYEYDADEKEGVFVGGLFWDGRATGWDLGSPAAEQALGPFLNPVEQNLASGEQVVRKICDGAQGLMFREAFGARVCSFASSEEILDAYDKVGLALAAFEASPFVNRFSSKYDRYLRGEAELTALERQGLELFDGKGKCSECHPSAPGPGGEPPLFTDNTFDNLGLPRNPRNPFYRSPDNPAGTSWVDPGLGGFLAGLEADPDPAFDYAAMAEENVGKHRVPTLRNVDKRPDKSFVKVYGHNGVFTSLEQIVHFYNTRDVLGDCAAVREPVIGANCWPAPEVAANVNREELGRLGLTDEEEGAIVAFLATLSDS